MNEYYTSSIMTISKLGLCQPQMREECQSQGLFLGNAFHGQILNLGTISKSTLDDQNCLQVSSDFIYCTIFYIEFQFSGAFFHTLCFLDTQGKVKYSIKIRLVSTWLHQPRFMEHLMQPLFQQISSNISQHMVLRHWELIN